MGKSHKQSIRKQIHDLRCCIQALDTFVSIVSIAVVGNDIVFTWVDNEGVEQTTVAPLPPDQGGFTVSGPDPLGVYTLTHTQSDGTVNPPAAITVPPPVDDGDYVLDPPVDNGDGTLSLSGTHTTSSGIVQPFGPVIIDVCAAVIAGCPDSFVVNPDGSITHTAIDGTIATSPASSVVVDGNPVGNQIAEHTANGITVPINETVTTVVNNGDGTFTYTDEAGVPITLSTCQLVLDGGCVPTVTPGPLPHTYTFDDGYGNTTVIDVNEIDMDINSVTVAGSVVTFTAEDGTPVVVDICAIVAANCNARLVDNGDGTFTGWGNDGSSVTIPAPIPSVLTQTVLAGNQIAVHDDGDGVVTPIFETITPLVDNGNGSLTYTDESGTVTTIDFDNSDVVSLNTGNVIATHDGGDGVLVNIEESVTTLVDNGNGTFTYVNEAGATTVLDFTNSTLSNNGNGTFTHFSGDGTSTIIDICQLIADGGCQATIVDNGDGSYTITGNDGVSHTIPAPVPETVTTLVDNGDGTFTYTNEAGVPVIFDVTNSNVIQVVAAGNVIATHDDGAGTLTDIIETVTTLVNNGAAGFTYTSEDGTATIIPPPDGKVTVEQIGGPCPVPHPAAPAVPPPAPSDGDKHIEVYDDCLLTYCFDGAAWTGPIPFMVTVNTSVVTPLVVGQIIATHDDGTGNLQNIQETVTTLVADGLGGYVYTSEDGTQTFVTAPSGGISWDPAFGEYQHTSSDGTIQTAPGTTLVPNVDGSWLLTDPTGNFLEICSCPVDGDGVKYPVNAESQPIIPAETTTTLVDDGDGTYTYTSEDGTVTEIDPCLWGRGKDACFGEDVEGSSIYTAPSIIYFDILRFGDANTGQAHDGHFFWRPDTEVVTRVDIEAILSVFFGAPVTITDEVGLGYNDGVFVGGGNSWAWTVAADITTLTPNGAAAVAFAQGLGYVTFEVDPGTVPSFEYYVTEGDLIPANVVPGSEQIQICVFENCVTGDILAFDAADVPSLSEVNDGSYTQTPATTDPADLVPCPEPAAPDVYTCERVVLAAGDHTGGAALGFTNTYTTDPQITLVHTDPLECVAAYYSGVSGTGATVKISDQTTSALEFIVCGMVAAP